jgi:hypothetical protein
MSPELKGVLIGAAISSIVPLLGMAAQFISGFYQRKADETIKYREALFKVAFDNWQAELGRKRDEIVPLEEYLIRMDSLYTLFLEEKVPEQKLNAKLNAFQLLKEQWDKKRQRNSE